jgi:hypothetical protein
MSPKADDNRPTLGITGNGRAWQRGQIESSAFGSDQEDEILKLKNIAWITSLNGDTL